jgi:hypothetical protein
VGSMFYNDDEESVPLCTLGEVMKDPGVPVALPVHDGSDPEKPDPFPKKKSVAVKVKDHFVSETQQCVWASFILLLVIGMIVLSYMFCTECLFGIMIISACLCPFMPYFNIPLWISILLITTLGISFVHRNFTFIWK